MSIDVMTNTTILTPAQVRTEKLAQQAGEAAARRAGDALKQHLGILTPEHVLAVKEKEHRLAFEALKRARNRGESFDLYSSAPGLRAIITEEGCDHLLTIFAKQELLSGYSDGITVIDQDEGLYELRLEQGTFFVAFNDGECVLHGSAKMAGSSIDKVYDKFIIPREYVLQIDGDSGETWRNV